jgi:nicotinamide-nucleotide amidase
VYRNLTWLPLLRDWELALPACVKLAYLPRPGIVRLRLTVVDKCAQEAEQILKVNIDKLLDIIGVHVFGYDDISLEESLGQLLRERHLTVATAESCTGGNIAKLLTSVPGSSAYFKGSVIAYDNQIKSQVLGVNPKILEDHGAVSQQVVEQMAEGVCRQLGTDTAMSTSGIAGPDGGTEEKPVGTTWICVRHGDRSVSRKYFSGGPVTGSSTRPVMQRCSFCGGLFWIPCRGEGNGCFFARKAW